MKEMKEHQQDRINPYDKLVVGISNDLTTRLSELISKLLNSAQDKLFNLSNEADNNEDQTRYFELMNQVRTLKSDIADSFNKNIKTYIVPASEFESKLRQHRSELDNELSLVGQDEMEGIVLVKGIGERAAARYHEQLSHLEARLEHLALKTTTVFKKDALLPTNFCQAFDDALADNFDNANKKILFGMYDNEVANKLGDLYDSLNKLMIDADILPQIKLHTQTQQSTRPLPKPVQAGNTAADEAAQQNNGTEDYPAAAGQAGGVAPFSHSGSNHIAGSGDAGGAIGGSGSNDGGGGNNISGFAMTAAPGGGYRRTTQNSPAEQSVNAANTSSNPTHSGGAGAGAGAGATGETTGGEQNTTTDGAEYQHYTAGMPANLVGRVLGNYIGTAFTPESTNKSSESYGEFFPESTTQHFGHQEVLQALSSVQNLPQFDQSEENRFDAEVLKQAVLAEIAKKSGGAVTKRINQIAEKTIDFIELIFDAIIDDKDISDTIKTLLLRLQIPIIKASMFDQEFFIYDNHPARVILDTIADIGVGVNEHTDEVYIQLDKTVSSILGEHELTTETFQDALDKLNAYVEEQEAVTRAQEEEEQNQILRKHARATVLKALRATTTGKTLPEEVHPLILKRWPTLMFNQYITNGKENNEWVDIVLTLRQIVDSVQPVTSAEQLAKLVADKDTLFEHTEKYLNSCSNSKKDVLQIISVYKEVVQEHIDDANFTKKQVSDAEEVISHTEPVEEAPVEEEISNKPSIPSNVMPGMWFQVFMGEDQPPRRCKLSVIIVEDANLMFVNHKGELMVEKSFDAFNEEVSNNTTKMIMGHSAFDHAFKSVINRLN